MSNSSTWSRLAAFLLVITIGAKALAQDIAGGASVIGKDISGGAGLMLANADVEAKLGKGIFTPPQNRPHVNKAPDKRLVRRTIASAHTRRHTGGGGIGGRGLGNIGNISNRTTPPIEAEAYNNQGD